ncbi:MAG: hypothetical protein DCC68_22110 [Planctomycetota bacterium]|nr:MAG: hypothetical protein DCC68_22110 [Planctomycetota bacterium]
MGKLPGSAGAARVVGQAFFLAEQAHATIGLPIPRTLATLVRRRAGGAVTTHGRDCGDTIGALEMRECRRTQKLRKPK